MITHLLMVGALADAVSKLVSEKEDLNKEAWQYLLESMTSIHKEKEACAALEDMTRRWEIVMVELEELRKKDLKF